MKLLFYILPLFSISSCTAVSKIFQKEKHKVEVSEFQQMTNVEVTETETSVNVQEFTASEIADFFKFFNFDYSGENNDDSAEIKLTKTDNSIIISVSGKAKTTYSESELNKKESSDHFADISNKVTQSKKTEFERQTDLVVKTKEKSETKEKFKVDFSIWLWLCGLIALLFFIYRKSKK